ncbi:MAG: hypothetical protein M0Z76_01975 [Gammaproteobacteria bacterium]|nr:hypothetical protein [Gammaproteobacteria bacterium]
MRKHAMLAALTLAAVTGVAYAQPGPMMAPCPPGAPCHQGRAMMGHPGMLGHPWMHGRLGVPMLLPLVEMRSYELKLTDSQASKLAVWRNEHLRRFIPALRGLWRDRETLHKDLLEGKSAKDLGDVANRIDRASAALLQMKIAQVEEVRATLTPDQWREAVRMYRDMQGRFMHPGHRPG